MKQLYLRHLLKFISFFVLMSLVVTPALQAQQQKLPVIDTLHIRAGTELKIDDSTHYYPNDTIMILSDTVVKNNPQLKTYLLYQKLENSAKKSVVTQKLFDIAFAGKDYLQRTDTIQQEKSGQRFDPYEGKIIRKVNYDVLDVIGPNVNDTVHYSLSDFQRWVNDLYPNTKDFVIKNNQLFKVGDSLDPLQLSNTERLLRELQSIKDARVEVRPLPGNPDSVDVRIIVKDKFPFGARIKAPATDEYNASFYTVNFMGWGHEFNNRVTVRPGHHPLFRYSRFNYFLPNIGGTFIQGQAELEWGDNSYLKRLSAQKFYEPLRPSWGGETKLEQSKYLRTDLLTNFENSGSDTILETPIAFGEKKLAVGYAFLYDQGEYDVPEFIVLSSSYLTRHFTERPEVSRDTNFQYQHRSDFLASISFQRNDYYRSRYINNFGITEDVPYGFNLSMTLGYELGEITNRTYGGVSISAGNFIRNFGYVYARAEAGSFIRNRHFEQGLFSSEISYFSKMFTSKNHFRTRFSVTGIYSVGLNRYHGEQMHILNSYALKGIDNRLLDGNQRLNLIPKVTFYTPWYLYGFRFALEAYSDMGMIGPNNTLIFNNQLYSGIGIGLMIRNENLAFQTVSISLTYYPILPENSSRRFHYDAQGKPIANFPDFEARLPEILSYRYYYHN